MPKGKEKESEEQQMNFLITLREGIYLSYFLIRDDKIEPLNKAISTEFGEQFEPDIATLIYGSEEDRKPILSSMKYFFAHHRLEINNISVLVDGYLINF